MVQQAGNNSSLHAFFDNLASFDTETTSVDRKTARIWQLGFAGSQTGIDSESVVNPFFVRDGNDTLVPEVLDPDQFKDKLTNINEEFSRKAAAKGQFNTIFQRHQDLWDGKVSSGLTLSLSTALEETLGKGLQNSDILVMQNANFENNVIANQYKEGLIHKDTMDRITSRMENVRLDIDGGVSHLFQVPPEVERHARQARKIMALEYLPEDIKAKSTFDKYTMAMNRMVDSYKVAFNTPNRKAIVVEQMDITRALYANAIQQGYMERRYADVGLKMDFLTNALLGRDEAHTALSDSKDTKEVFSRTWEMLEELRSGNAISDQTKTDLAKIHKAQALHVNEQFLTTVKSVLNDFDQNGGTNYSAKTRGNFYTPPTLIKNKSTGDVVPLPMQKHGSRSWTTDLDEAMDNILHNYRTFDDTQFREEFVQGVKESIRGKGTSITLQDIGKKVDTFDPSKLPQTPNGLIPQSLSSSWWEESTTLFGREMSRKAKGGIIGGAAALVGYMALKDSPKPKEENSYVAQQFYDDQYLGTEFVNFNNRNKHYMY